MGNRTSVMENDGRRVTYTYDELYRLTQEKVLDAVNGDRSSGYVYDNVGNRLTKTETVNGTTTTTGYTYDANDRLLREMVNGQITTTYTYDDNGNTLTKTEPGQETRYTWDDQNRLVAAEIVTADGIKHLEYEYDASGIRVASKVDGQETRYLIDANQPYAQVLEEYTPDATVQVSYVYGNDLISQTQSTGTTYYHVDGLGSTTALTDETGTVVSTSRYDAYGEKTGETGNVSNKYLFAGEQYDQNLGDYYLRARYYDSDTGRFTRRDIYEGSQSDPISLHKYIYANSNPANYTDPTGYFSWNETFATLNILSTLVSIGDFVAHPSPQTAFFAFIGAIGLPPGLAKGIQAVFGSARAGNIIKGFSTALSSLSNKGEVALQTLARARGLEPVLGDQGLKTLAKAIFGKTAALKKVDLVAQNTTTGKFVLMEAKPSLGSSQFEEVFGAASSKFDDAIKVLEEYHKAGGQAFPGVGEIIISAPSVNWSQLGKWAVKSDGTVWFNGAQKTINGLPVKVQINSFL